MVNTNDDRLNSSDVEFSPAQPSRFKDVGKESIQAMLDTKFEDRLSSKKTVTQLRNSKGSGLQQYQNALWDNRFNSFRSETLRCDTKTTPTGDHIERFLTTIVTKVKPRSGHGVPSEGFLQAGLSCLCSSLIFRYKDFHLSRHDRTRIAVLLDDLTNKGLLTREPMRQKEWVGVILVEAMTTSLLESALTRGTRSWDVTIQKVTSILLCSSLCCRVGDINRSLYDDQSLPFLAWKDIELALVTGSEEERFVAKITIRNEKGHKKNPRKNRIVTLNSFQESSENTLDTVKFIIILALRTGNLDAQNIKQLISDTANKARKVITWRYADRPVLGAFAQGSGLVEDPETSAPAGQYTASLADAANAAGLLAKLVGHDLRRGAAREVANLKRKPAGVGNTVVASALGHSRKSLALGVTDEYVGSNSTDFWTARVREPHQDPFGVTRAETAYETSRLSKAMLDQECKRQGVDGSIPHKRRKVARGYQHKQWEAWREVQDKGEPKEDIGPHTRMKDIDQDDEPSAYDSDDPIDQNSDGSDADESNLPIDPRLLEETHSLEKAITGVEIEGLSLASEEAIFNAAMDGQTQSTSSSLNLRSIDFIDYFAKLNIVRNEKTASLRSQPTKFAEAQERHEGNGKDSMTLYQFRCKNSAYGCDFVSCLSVSARHHKIFCQITEQFPLEVKRPYACQQCSKRFSRKDNLVEHIKAEHSGWQPQQCTRKGQQGCNEDAIFQTKAALHTHTKKVHYANFDRDTYQPTKCMVLDCTNDKLYEKRDSLISHVKRVHKLTHAQALQYVPKQKKWEHRKCPLDDCSAKRIFRGPIKLRAHFNTSTHKGRGATITEEEMEAYLA